MGDAAPSLAGRRLLIVEDEYVIATMMVEALEECGAEIVGMAASSAEAQAMIEAIAGRLDAAVLDINLGNERVYPVADTLMARKIPFVFATGYGRTLIPKTYAAIPCCEKPIQMEELARVLIEQIGS